MNLCYCCVKWTYVIFVLNEPMCYFCVKWTYVLFLWLFSLSFSVNKYLWFVYLFNVNHLKYLLQKKYAPGIFREGENLGFKTLKDYFECYISPHTFIQMTTKFISKLIQNSCTQLFCDILEDIKKFRPSLWRSWNKLAKLKFIPWGVWS